MPQGPGTYGSKRGRPPKKKKAMSKKKVGSMMKKASKKRALPKRNQRASKGKK